MRALFPFVAVWLVGSLAAQDVAKLVEQMGAADHNTRYAAYRTLMRKKPPQALPLLAKALPTWRVSAQSLGISLVQMYPMDKSMPVLRNLRKCGSPFVEVAAASALYQRGEKSRENVDHILRALKSCSTRSQRSMALGRLYSVTDPRVLTEIRGMLRPGVLSSSFDQALRLLMNAKDLQAIPVVKKLLETPETLGRGVVAVCAAFLAAMGDASHAKTLAEELKAGGPTFSRAQSFLRQAQSLPELVLDALLEFAESGTEPTYVGYALDILAQHKFRKAIPVMKQMLTNENPRIAKAAFDAVLRLGEDIEPKFLKGMLDAAKPEMCIAAADALRRMDDNSGLRALIEIASKKGGAHKTQAVAALGKFRVKAAVDPLIAALSDSNASVRRSAFQNLGSVFRSLFPYRRLDLSTTGYTATGGNRPAAVALIRDWWTKHR